MLLTDGEVPDRKQQDGGDDPKRVYPAWRVGDESLVGSETLQLTLSVLSHAPWFVHRQRRGHEQRQQGETRIDYQLDSKPAELDIGQCRRCRCPCETVGWLHVHQQEDDGNDGYQQFKQDPVMPEQAPRGTHCEDKSGEQRSEAQRDENEPTYQLHGKTGGMDHLRILAAQSSDGESEESSDRAEPAHRGNDMRGERELEQARCRSHEMLLVP